MIRGEKKVVGRMNEIRRAFALVRFVAAVTWRPTGIYDERAPLWRAVAAGATLHDFPRLKAWAQSWGRWRALQPSCEWRLDVPEYNTWATACGNLFFLEADTPRENEMRFCPFCGRALEQVEEEEEQWWE